jgi:hypothetical protein
MKHTLWLIVFFCSLQLAQAQHLGAYQHGTVVRMRMDDCAFAHHGFMVAMSGGPAQAAAQVCPEYTLVSDQVVFVIVGKSSNQLVPLAEEIDFRFHKNELVVRVDDEKQESKFTIKEMMLRSEWDHLQKYLDDQRNAPNRLSDSAMAMRTSE